MNKAFVFSTVFCLFISNFSSADTFGTGENQFEIEFVGISGNASSANGTNISHYSPGESGYKTFSDPSNFRIGVYEVTNDHWNKFKRAYGVVTGNPSRAYDENPYFTGTNVPTNNVSWYEAAQFVNWLNTSNGHQAAYKFTGTQGTSGYTLEIWDAADAWGGTNLYRHKDAYYFLPSEDEWIKAAYWNGSVLQTYSNASVNDLTSGIPDPEKWNYYDSAGNEPWDVGSGALELNGTYDMMGNVSEWVESPYMSDNYVTAAYRSTRGGSYVNGYDNNLNLPYRFYMTPDIEGINKGFRVASVIPEPATVCLLTFGGLALRRKRYF